MGLQLPQQLRGVVKASSKRLLAVRISRQLLVPGMNSQEQGTSMPHDRHQSQLVHIVANTLNTMHVHSQLRAGCQVSQSKQCNGR